MQGQGACHWLLGCRELYHARLRSHLFWEKHVPNLHPAGKQRRTYLGHMQLSVEGSLRPLCSQVVELDPGNASAQQNVQRLTPLAQQEQEKLKDEMIGELPLSSIALMSRVKHPLLTRSQTGVKTGLCAASWSCSQLLSSPGYLTL